MPKFQLPKLGAAKGASTGVAAADAVNSASPVVRMSVRVKDVLFGNRFFQNHRKAAIAIGVAGLLAVGGILAAVLHHSPVKVYSVAEVAMIDEYAAAVNTEGVVSSAGVQRVMPSETMQVEEVLVEPGQTVIQGQVLLTYDTTLTEVELQRARIQVARLERDLERQQSELAQLNAMSPFSSWLVVPENNVSYNPSQTGTYVSGTGTESDPLYYLWSLGDSLSQDCLREMATTALAQGAGHSGEAYVALVERENNALNGRVTQIWCMRLSFDPAAIVGGSGSTNGDGSGGGSGDGSDPGDGSAAGDGGAGNGGSASGEGGAEQAPTTQIKPEVGIQFCVLDLPESITDYEEVPEPYWEQSGSPFSAQELASMRQAQQEVIRQTEQQLNLARLDLEQKESQFNADGVPAAMDGVVTAVNDPATAAAQGKPIVEVSAGDGFYIRCGVAESNLDRVMVGQTVSVNSWESGVSCDGVISEIGTAPEQGLYVYSNMGSTNPNMSVYPITIKVDASQMLSVGSGVSVSYVPGSQEGLDGTVFLPSPFVVYEGSGAYVYVADDQGKLERRQVRVGMTLWGEYVQILGGLSLEDRVAFPYGDDVVEGAATQDAPADDLYSLSLF